MKKLTKLISLTFLLPILILNIPMGAGNFCGNQGIAPGAMTCCGFLKSFDNSTVISHASQGCECKLAENSLTDFSLVFLAETRTLKLKKLVQGISGKPDLSYIVVSRDFSNWSTSQTILSSPPKLKIYDLISSYLI